MKTNERGSEGFEVTEKFTTRAFELLDESQAMQFAEGLRLNHAASMVFRREEKRLRAKYGDDDPRVKEMSLRSEASDAAKLELFARYSDAMTPPTTIKEGWAVDGFVRAPSGAPVEGLTVAAYDKDGNIHKDLGRAVTDAKGYFSIKVEKLPEKPPSHVFMRAVKGRTLLDSKEVRLEPVAGASERVEILLVDRGTDKPDKPVEPDRPPIVVTDRPSQPDKTSVPVTDKPAQPDKASVPVTDKPSRPGGISFDTVIKPPVAGPKPRGTKKAAKGRAKAKAKTTPASRTKKTTPAKKTAKKTTTSRAKSTKRKK